MSSKKTVYEVKHNVVVYDSFKRTLVDRTITVNIAALNAWNAVATAAQMSYKFATTSLRCSIDSSLLEDYVTELVSVVPVIGIDGEAA